MLTYCASIYNDNISLIRIIGIGVPHLLRPSAYFLAISLVLLTAKGDDKGTSSLTLLGKSIVIIFYLFYIFYLPLESFVRS